MEKKKMALITMVVIGIFIIIWLLSNWKMLMPDDYKEKRAYNIEDYIQLKNYDIEKHCETCKGNGYITTASFQNLPETITKAYIKKQETFEAIAQDHAATLENHVYNSTYYDIVSVLCKTSAAYQDERSPDETYDLYGFNVHAKTGEIVTNQELLEMFQIRSFDMYEEIFPSISGPMSYFGAYAVLESDDDDPASQEYVYESMLQDIYEHRFRYCKELEDNYDLVHLFISEDHLYVAFFAQDILDAIQQPQKELEHAEPIVMLIDHR